MNNNILNILLMSLFSIHSAIGTDSAGYPDQTGDVADKTYHEAQPVGVVMWRDLPLAKQQQLLRDHPGVDVAALFNKMSLQSQGNPLLVENTPEIALRMAQDGIEPSKNSTVDLTEVLKVEAAKGISPKSDTPKFDPDAFLRTPAYTPTSVISSPPDLHQLAQSLSGASIFASDGTFLGMIGPKSDSKSVFNQFGTYGSKFSTESILDPFGKYGSEFSDQSPFNQFTHNCPKVVTPDKRWAYLTENKNVNPHIDTLTLLALKQYF